MPHPIITLILKRSVHLLEIFLVFVILWFLEPVEELSTGILEFEQHHSSCGTLAHSLQLSIPGKDDKVLPTHTAMFDALVVK